MATTRMSLFVQQLRKTVQRHGFGSTDGQLLNSFVHHKDDAALAALVRRHGPMVWGVCCRLLRSHHDAEDAFQATFLVLVQKAATLPDKEMVGNWLFGVARQTAVRMRALAARRGVRERQVTVMPEPTTTNQHFNDLKPFLDEELSRLPAKYRVLILLCDMEGKTRKDVARQFDVPEGTVASRLATARVMLAKRLAQRGVIVSGGLLGTMLSQQAGSAAVPTSVLSSTIQAVTSVAAGQAAAAGVISPKVAALTQGVLKAMLMSKLKAVIAVVLMLGLMATGAAVLSCRTATAQCDKPPIAEERVKAPQKQEREQEKENVIAWGQDSPVVACKRALAELAMRTTYGIGGKGQGVRGRELRNVSKETIKVSAYPLWTSYPRVVDARGDQVRDTTAPSPDFEIIPQSLTLKPGETVDVEKTDLLVAELNQQVIIPDGVVDMCAIHVKPGKHKADCIGFLKEHPTLATGTVEFEVKPAKDESFTVWGKEVGGVQAGIGYLPGQHRAYRIGETVTLVVRVRNLGKKEVKFAYFNEFFWENPPKVMDGEGKPVPLTGVFLSGWPILSKVNLAPGKEVNVCQLNLALRPASESKDRPVWTLYGTGKFQIQHENIGGGNIGTGEIKFDPILSKLATGKLELEVKDAEKVPEKQEKEGFTAWGKEVGGLQAGLGFRPGEKRAYRHGEAVTLVVRVRNVGKEEVKFKYLLSVLDWVLRPP